MAHLYVRITGSRCIEDGRRLDIFWLGVDPNNLSRLLSSNSL
ncbi:MAG: hypothetical protein PHR69_11040 [Sphaerochaeta sp.]|nr:hypothetical protein [Sphaerochaeta sp.]